MKDTIRKYFKELCELSGVSGHEQEVVKYVKAKIEPFADEVIVDNNGNVIAIKKGLLKGPKLMICAHADEVGYCVRAIYENGFIGFDKIGSQSDKVMEGRKVLINREIPGIIGIKPGHLQSPEEGRKVKTPGECYVDIGTSSKDEVIRLGIKIGDPISFQGCYMEMSNKDLICSKAVDDRINCAILIELFNQIKNIEFGGTLYGVISVQEEIGMRGAFMAGNLIQPDYAIIIDTIPAGDTPDVQSKDLPIYLGKGPAIPVADGVLFGILSTVIHPKVRMIIEKQAENAKVDVQLISLAGANYATDNARLNLASNGIPSGTLTVPRRYSHSPVELFNINDAVGSLAVLINIVQENAKADLSFI